MAPADGGFAPLAEAPAVPVWQQQPVPQGYGYYPPQPPAQSDGLAVTSLIASLVWLGGVGSIVGVVTGHLSRSRAAKEGRPQSGLALAGLIIGYLGLAGMLAVVALFAAGAAIFASATQDLIPRSDLQDAARIEDSWYATHHVYLDDAELHQQTDANFFSDLTVVEASETRYCLRASVDDGRLWYWSSEAPHATRTACA